MTKTCIKCTEQFEVTQEDLEFLDKVSPIFNGQKYSIPVPIHCPDCRLQRRLAFCNVTNVYNRKCDLTGKQLISMYRPDSDFKVYNVSDWESDKFDATQYGRDFDFSRPFFEQFRELQLDVPRPHLTVVQDTMENSDYVNGANNVKNSYLSSELGTVEDIYYSHSVFNSKNCVDCLHVKDCEICYECINSKKLYQCFWCENCTNCSDSYFLIDCIGCKDCFGCVNLRNKQYYIYNKKHTKEEYENFINSIKFTPSKIKEYQEKFENLYLSLPHKFTNMISSENSTGNYLEGNQNCNECYLVGDSRDLKNCYYIVQGVDCQDLTCWGEKVELSYHCSQVGINAYKILFSLECFNNASNIIYCDFCYTSVSDLFGCVGLKRKQYCVLNKQYSKEEYKELVSKIIEHMKGTGEWGQYFPISFSPFAYNETPSSVYYPLTPDEVNAIGSKWYQADKKSFYDGPEYNIPEDITEVDQSVCNQILKCEKTAKRYRIIPQEFEFYKKYGLPIPKLCPDQRHKEKLNIRTSWHLHDRKCQKCDIDLKSCYSVKDPEIIYCEKCYLESVI